MGTKIINKKLFIILLTIIIMSFTNCLFIHADDMYGISKPPEDGPSVQGNFFINPTNTNVQQDYANYPNMQVITDGQKNDGAQTMWWHNKVDITKPFTIKFYAYLSPSLKNNDRYDDGMPIMADGITFTLQNDNNGSAAIGGNGEGLGVYGDYRDDQTYASTYASTSINNAFSYEFDPYFNGDTPGLFGDPHSSDFNLKTRDGNGYSIFRNINNQFPPGDEGQHTAFTTTNNGLSPYQNKSRNGNSQFHYDAQPLTIWNPSNDRDSSAMSNKYFLSKFAGNWHQVIYKWEPDNHGNGTATVDVDRNQPINHIIQQHKINIKEILNANNDDPYVWWGFTGSTGGNTMISAIADTDVTGDPGITKLVLDLSKLSDKQKSTIKQNINSSKDIDENEKNRLLNCIDNPSDSSSDPELSNQLVKLIPSDDFKSVIGSNSEDNDSNADVGDVLLYKVNIYNYTMDNIKNDWRNVNVYDENLHQRGMTSLDDKNNIDINNIDIPSIDINSKDSNKPTSVGLRTIVNSKYVNNPRSNTVRADGGNFLQNRNINGPDVNRSSRADVYVNPNSAKVTPRVNIDNKMTDKSSNNSLNKDTDSLVQVKGNKNDDIHYDISLDNIVNDSNTSNKSTYSFWVPSLDNINNNINISFTNNNNNNEITAKNESNVQDKNSDLYYTVTNDYSSDENNKDNTGISLNKDLKNDNNKRLITVHNLPSIHYHDNSRISADIKIGEPNYSDFASTPIFHDYGTNNYYAGNKEKYNFDVGNISLEHIRNIDYGLSSGYLNNGFISPYRITNRDDSYSEYTYDKNSYTMAQIIDTRIRKSKYSIDLSQSSDDNASSDPGIIGSKESPFILRFLNNDIPEDISKTPVPVYSNNPKNANNSDTEYSNISWNKEHELRLGSNKSFKGKIEDGAYNAHLNWIIKDGAP